MEKAYIIDSGTRDGVSYVRLGNTGNFSVFKTFDCGQCFRFDPSERFSEGLKDGAYEVSGIAFGRHVTFREDGCAVMRRAAEVSRGIRILRQDPWETLCSFIISQNNNIPRIKKIISALCEKYGEITADGRGYAFPTARALADAGEEAICALKTGFRAKYIIDAAVRVADGEIDLGAVAATENYADAEAELMKIKGVGPKVAACALLFGFGKTEAYPVDTWMKKVAARHFAAGPDPKLFGKAAGIAQQYLFYMERYVNGGK